jgi:hypothetical protein
MTSRYNELPDFVINNILIHTDPAEKSCSLLRHTVIVNISYAAFESKILPFNYVEWRKLNPHNITWMPQQMSWLHRHQWVPYCQLNCVCHQMKLLLGGVASLFRRHWGRSCSARQLNSYTASGLWVSLKPYWTLAQTLERISRICILLLLYFWLDVQYFCQYLTNSSLCVNMRFAGECLGMSLTNCMVYGFRLKRRIT